MYTVLLVDDEVIITTQISEWLVEDGYEVLGIATSGEEGVAMARELRPHIVLMDIKMQGKIDGIQAAHTIVGELDNAIIFLTAYAEEDLIERAKALLPLAYVMKPVRREQLRAAIEIALNKQRMDRRIRESEYNFRAMAENANDGIWIVLPHGRPGFVNRRASEITGHSREALRGIPFADLIPHGEPPMFSNGQARDMETIGYETEIEHHEGHPVPIEVTVAKTTWHDAMADLLIVRDITDRKRAQHVLQDAHDQLEQRVAERTSELELKHKKLEEVNTALKVLLQQREEDKKETEKGIHTQIKELAMPYLMKLKRSLLTSAQKSYVEILEENLNDIIDPLARNLSASMLNLTPAEIRVANLVILGKTTKEMAEVLNLSTRTIESHRDSIRYKLGIKNRKANLRSHLLSLQ